MNELRCPYCGGVIPISGLAEVIEIPKDSERCESLSPETKTRCQLRKDHAGDHRSLSESLAWYTPEDAERDKNR